MHDVSFESMLNTIKVELYKLKNIMSLPQIQSAGNYHGNIVSLTSDGASTQRKLNRLLKKEVGKTVVENKCAMHLGVNLRHAQVKAVFECVVLIVTHKSNLSLSQMMK